MATFTNGLQEGKFLFSLYKNDLKTISDILYRDTKYMNTEDALLANEEKPKKRERQEEARQERGKKIARTGDRREDRRSKPPTRRFISFTSLNTPIDQVLATDQGQRSLDIPWQVKGRP